MATGSPVVGRDSAKAALGQALEQAGAGAGRLVLVAGEPGIGKSALLGWLAGLAEPGCLVLRGFCWDGAGAPPYWPWSQVLRASELGVAELGEAGRLLELSGSSEPVGSAAAADAEFRLFESAAGALGGLAAQRPVVVLLDDLHWADEPSLRLLGFLARAAGSQRVLLVGGYRDGEAPPGLLELAGSAMHVPLLGLSLAEAVAMVASLPGSALPPEVTDQVWRRAGGNPFFVGELARLVQAQGDGQPSPRLPVGVRETVWRRLARLPTECVRLLDWAAVAGREIDLSLIVMAGGASDQELATDLLGLAVRAGIVLDGPARFTHDLYREAILDGMPAQTRRELDLRIGQALARSTVPGGAARVAAHLVRAGSAARADALAASLRAAREATARLGHEDAVRHYEQALALTDLPGEVLLDLAAALDRAGRPDQARENYRSAAELAGDRGDPVLLAHAALGLHSLGTRSGSQSEELARLLHHAAAQLDGRPGSSALRSRLLAALTRVGHHAPRTGDVPDLVATAQEAVALAETAEDPGTLATAQLALHDALWEPDSARVRLPVIEAMLAAAAAAGDPDLRAQALLLRATVLVELGDPAGVDELLGYVGQAEALGHRRGRWGALTRRATYAQIVGQVEDAVRLGEQALELGLAIGEPDAVGCFCTHRWALVALGVREPEMPVDTTDPIWPLMPLIRAWPPAVRGDEAAARAELGDFSVLAITPTHDLERLAVAAVVFAVAGSAAQRRWAYDRLAPHAGQHVVVGGAAAYHAAVEHHLGVLASALGDSVAAERHHQAALAQHQRLGAAGWARISERLLASLGVVSSGASAGSELRLTGDGRWLVCFAGRRSSLPDAKGLHDLHAILAAGGRDVHVLDLLGSPVPSQLGRFGADDVLDDRARAEYAAHLAALDERIEVADALGDATGSERLASERSAILRELASASGLGGRPRRLGDATERARKTVSARVRDSLVKLDQVHPELAAHLRASVRMGSLCAYRPDEPVAWRLGRQ